MNYKQIWLGVRTVGVKGLYLARKYKPEIMMVASAVSGIACILSVRKAAKTEQAIIDQHNKNIIEAHELVKNNPNLTEKQGKRIVRRVYEDTGVQLLKLYGPSVAFGIASGTFSAMGFFMQKKRTNNAVAALATAVAAQKKFMEDGKLPELPSADAEDSSKEGESPDSKEEKGIPPRRKKFEIFFGPGSILWEEYDELRAGRGQMIVAKLQSMQIYQNTLLQAENKEFVTVNNLAECLYPSSKDQKDRVRIFGIDPSIPITWNAADGQMWGFRADPDKRFIDMFGIGNFTSDMLLDIMKKDGGIWLTIDAEYLGDNLKEGKKK